MGVPVAMGNSVLAVLYAGTREPLSVGGRAVEAMSQVALRVGGELGSATSRDARACRDRPGPALAAVARSVKSSSS